MNDLASFLKKLNEEQEQPEKQDSLTEREGHQGAQYHRDQPGYEGKEKSNPHIWRRFRRFNLINDFMA